MSALAEFVRDIKELSAGRVMRLANAIFRGETPDRAELENLSPDEVEAIGQIVEAKSKQQHADELLAEAKAAEDEITRIRARMEEIGVHVAALHKSIEPELRQADAEFEALKIQLEHARDISREKWSRARTASVFAMEAEQVGA